jgi:hypothetical protein
VAVRPATLTRSGFAVEYSTRNFSPGDSRPGYSTPAGGRTVNPSLVTNSTPVRSSPTVSTVAVALPRCPAIAASLRRIPTNSVAIITVSIAAATATTLAPVRSRCARRCRGTRDRRNRGIDRV